MVIFDPQKTIVRIMKKMYNQPQTDVTVVNTEHMMQDLNVSINGGGSGEQHAPARGEIIP